MRHDNPAWLDYQRKRWLRPNAHLYLRPDAWRYAKPGTEGYDPPPGIGYREPAHYRLARDEAALAGATAAATKLASDERAFRRELASLRFELQLLKLSLRGAKANFDPAQPRDDEGRWSDAGGIAADPQIADDAASGQDRLDAGTIYAAGFTPRIPGQRPPNSGERTAIAKAVAIWAAEQAISAGDFIGRTSWLYGALPSISSYLDAPKPLAGLQDDLAAKPGYDVHHIVERSPALADGYLVRRIDDPGNLVRTPRMKHWEINAWYQTESRDFGWVSPRDYLRGKDWDERRRIGLFALEKFRVLRK